MEIQNEAFLQKKIEKIAQAIYLVSNHLKDTEPLKWELRKESLNFLTCLRSLGEGSAGRDVPPDLVIDVLTSCGRDLIAYLSLSVISGLVSRNNGALVMNEIEGLLATFEQVVDEHTAKAGFILSEDFFATDPDLTGHSPKKVDKGQNGNFISDIRKAMLGIRQEVTSAKGHNHEKNHAVKAQNVKDKKDNRQTKIISLLRTQPNLTIKDFVKVIHDCSEKTIQRELIALMEKGIVKKEGERRWSTYSLK